MEKKRASSIRKGKVMERLWPEKKKEVEISFDTGPISWVLG